MKVIDQLVNEIDEIRCENRELRKRLAELSDKPLDNRPKLSEREVRDIRDAHRGGMSQQDLASNYGVNPATISRTVRGLYHC